jgi:hypothetical protein
MEFCSTNLLIFSLAVLTLVIFSSVNRKLKTLKFKQPVKRSVYKAPYRL